MDYLMDYFNKRTLGFLAFLSFNINASVDQYSDINGDVDLHVDSSTPYVFDTKDIDSGNVDITNDYDFTIKKSGLYKISYQLNWSTDNLSRRQVKTYVVKNGQDTLNGSYAYGYARREDQAGNATNNASFYVKLSVDDYVNLMHQKESSVIGQAFSIQNESTISFELINEILDPNELSGQYGNVALIDTNNLSIQSYSASSTYYADSPAGAFDGYIFTGMINANATQKVKRGVWMSNTGLNTNQWLQVDFSEIVTVTGLRVVLNAPAANLGRVPKEITLQISNDGITFENKESFTLDNVTDQVITLSSKVDSEYFRLFINNNYGGQYVQIDELELIQ